jgi:hypothetical protein
MWGMGGWPVSGKNGAELKAFLFGSTFYSVVPLSTNKLSPSAYLVLISAYLACPFFASSFRGIPVEITSHSVLPSVVSFLFRKDRWSVLRAFPIPLEIASSRLTFRVRPAFHLPLSDVNYHLIYFRTNYFSLFSNQWSRNEKHIFIFPKRCPIDRI